jgi:hypothetical protein
MTSRTLQRYETGWGRAGVRPDIDHNNAAVDGEDRHHCLLLVDYILPKPLRTRIAGGLP